MLTEPRPHLQPSEPVIPAGHELITILLGRLGEHSYEGGVNGTCYQCPFGTVPLEPNGRDARWQDISNDPTEAYYRCYLPGRTPEVEWGEYAPCDEKEWVAALRVELAPHLGPSSSDTNSPAVDRG